MRRTIRLVMATLSVGGTVLLVSGSAPPRSSEACGMYWVNGGGAGGANQPPAYQSSVATMWYLVNTSGTNITVNGGSSSVTGNIVDHEVDLPWTTVGPNDWADLYVIVETGAPGSATIDLTVNLSGGGCSGNYNASPTKYVTIQ